MLKTTAFVFLLFAASVCCAQDYYNEWIDHSKTYYRFKVGSTGLYRINGNVLAARNLDGEPVEHFQLWRNGKQVAIYTSIASGPIGTSGFIEFWGEKNDGLSDRNLYRDPSHHLNDKVSLLTDTAAYFLTVSPSANNLRFTPVSNNVAANTLPVQPYLEYAYRHNFMQEIARGVARNFGEQLYSSTYDKGEMWSSREIYVATPLIHNVSNLYVAAGGTSFTLKALMAGGALNGRQYTVQINNTVVVDSSLSEHDAGLNVKNNLPLSILGQGSLAIKISNLSTLVNQTDRIVCGFLELTYPRQFNFNNEAQFAFSMPASTSGNYLEITNFRTNGVAPVLYDLTNKRRYLADISTPGIVKVVLQPSPGSADYVLVSQNEYTLVTDLLPRTFIDYRLPSNQGDYLLVSHPILQQSYNGVNQVEEYRAYRSSVAGGMFNARIVDIDQLQDQFGYGIKKNPLCIKNFLRFARSHFAVAPKYVLLIGKGVTYNTYRMNQSSSYADRLNIIPTWGYPASDNLLASDDLDPVIKTGIGRLSAVTPQEVFIYLQKVKQYEMEQQNPSYTIEKKGWMKNVVHVVGGNDKNIEATLQTYMNGYAALIRDTLYGAKVENFSKATSGPVTPITNQVMRQLFQSGVSMINYFGHSSATALDYNLEDPYSYDNAAKYPMFLINGCNSGNIFSFDTSRFVVLSTLSERFVLAEERGSIGFIASTHFGLSNYLNSLTEGFYKSLNGIGYRKSVSQNILAGLNNLLTNSGYEMTPRLHAEQITLHGDPALFIHAHKKPDFIIEEPQISIIPNIVSVSDLKFQVKAFIWNVGKATGDSLLVQVKHQYPDGSQSILFQKRIISTRNKDSLVLEVQIDPLRDKGENKIIVTADLDNVYDELSEANNTNARVFVIQDNGIRTVYPVDFSIVNKSNIKLAVSTSNPLAPVQTYTMEIDTTELFSSPVKVTKAITSAGGLIEFDPGFGLRDSTVYYWRVNSSAAVSQWVTSSFIYLPGTHTGFNQSHLYQHLKSSATRMSMEPGSRNWKFGKGLSNMVLINAVPAVSGWADTDFSISVDGNLNIYSACVGHSVLFNVFDPITMKPYYNQPQPSTIANGVTGRFMNSGFDGNGDCDKPGRQFNFEYSYMDTTSRRWMRDFLDWVPTGAIVTARIILDPPLNQNPYVDVWKADQAIYGVGNTIYDRLKSAGFADIDSFDRPRTWVFVYKKDDPSFAPVSSYSVAMELITLSVNIATPDTAGFVTSPKFGPARSWKEVKWRGASLDSSPGDEVKISVIGITASGAEDTLYQLTPGQQDVDISGVSATQYPYMRLHMHNQDSVHLSPYQLRYWRLYYEPVPEGALAANLTAPVKDTFESGEQVKVEIAFKNVSDVTFADSIPLRIILFDESNVPNIIAYAPLKKLQPGDTALIRTEIDTKIYRGKNTLYVDVNPGLIIPEQYRFNNFMYKNFLVKKDVFNPLLDVTFDGVHILNEDIVSSKPKIVVKLKDEAKYLPLDDTSLATIYVRYPGNADLRRFAYGTDTLRFVPADITTGKNEATIEFNPAFQDGGETAASNFYELVVRGKDRSGNPTSTLDYHVRFQVINKPMITEVFNYPNPFTSSTAFVFTLTGSEVPQNIRIQILTITGKVVKEITKQEMGPLRIGRNITEYKWDGTDQYGQKLANGIYLYRVLTNHNGSHLEKYQPGQVKTDQYFNAGYGKMYLMR